MFQNNLSPLQTPSRTSSRNNLQVAKDDTQVCNHISKVRTNITIRKHEQEAAAYPMKKEK